MSSDERAGRSQAVFVKISVAHGAVKAPKLGMEIQWKRNENASQLTSKPCVSGRTTVAVTLSFLHGQSDGFGCFDGSAGQFASPEEQQVLSDFALSVGPNGETCRVE